MTPHRSLAYLAMLASMAGLGLSACGAGAKPATTPGPSSYTLPLSPATSAPISTTTTMASQSPTGPTTPTTSAPRPTVPAVVTTQLPATTTAPTLAGSGAADRIVKGVLDGSGGPFGTPPQPVTGIVTLTNSHGKVLSAQVGHDGAFSFAVMPGTYRISGHSPQITVNGHPEICGGLMPTVRVSSRKTTIVDVYCSHP